MQILLFHLSIIERRRLKLELHRFSWEEERRRCALFAFKKFYSGEEHRYEMEQLTEEEKKALRGSKFAPLPSSLNSSRSQPRLAHPGGPVRTNKAAALAKFLERKLQDPNGLASLDPRLIELAVKNAKDTVQSSGTSSRGRTVQHVDSFGDSEASAEDEERKISAPKKSKKNKKRKKKLKKEKQCKKMEESSSGMAKKSKKRLKL